MSPCASIKLLEYKYEMLRSDGLELRPEAFHY